MGHLAVETLLGQTARDVADAKEANHTDDTLREFGKCAIALRTVLHQDRPRSENHIRVLEMAYLRRKRKHGNMGINDRVGGAVPLIIA